MGAVIVFTLTVSLRGTVIGNAGPGYLFMLPMMVGMVLAQGGWGRRVGESLHCPRCEYEFTFAERDAPIRCPECGTPWLGLLRKGRRVMSIKMMVSGISIALLGAVLFQPIFWLGPFVKILPTPILYTALYMDPRSSIDAWDELNTRSLSATSTLSLARRVAAHRLQHQWGSPADKWFEANVAAGRIPAALQERLWRESFVTHLDLPKEVRAGTSFPVRLRTLRAANGFSSQLAVMFAGYSLDGAELVGRVEEPAWAYQLRPSPFRGPRTAFEQQFRIDTPGKHSIRATYWVIFQPSFWAIAWGPDGTPIRPTAATWFERIDLEREIIVK
jgi:DNA-directed RNA polymerase subunit RPC12/RpoP